VRERQPGVRTALGVHARWWGQRESNLDDIVFVPIGNDATRVAALLTGEVDVIDPVPLQDMARVKAAPGLDIQQTAESRIVFLGFDQKRDELLVSNVKGKNPFKDQRVRQAVYQAIDIDTITSRVMRGVSKPTGAMVADGIRGYATSMETRLPFNLEASRKLLAEAGYPEGFEAGFNCPNDRYANDAEICQAVAANLARVGIRLTVQAEGKATYFPRALKRDVSMFMLGWSPAGYDAHNLLYTVLATPAGAQGQWNFGAYSNPRLDALTQRIQTETDDGVRNGLIAEALAIHAKDVGHVPLHQQMVVWGVRTHVKAYQRADGFMLFKWMTVGKR
jgi:peptide/nickel transport system substrate-binding protein